MISKLIFELSEPVCGCPGDSLRTCVVIKRKFVESSTTVEVGCDLCGAKVSARLDKLTLGIAFSGSGYTFDEMSAFVRWWWDAQDPAVRAKFGTVENAVKAAGKLSSLPPDPVAVEAVILNALQVVGTKGVFAWEEIAAREGVPFSCFQQARCRLEESGAIVRVEVPPAAWAEVGPDDHWFTWYLSEFAPRKEG